MHTGLAIATHLMAAIVSAEITAIIFVMVTR